MRQDPSDRLLDPCSWQSILPVRRRRRGSEATATGRRCATPGNRCIASHLACGEPDLGAADCRSTSSPRAGGVPRRSSIAMSICLNPHQGRPKDRSGASVTMSMQSGARRARSVSCAAQPRGRGRAGRRRCGCAQLDLASGGARPGRMGCRRTHRPAHPQAAIRASDALTVTATDDRGRRFSDRYALAGAAECDRCGVGRHALGAELRGGVWTLRLEIAAIR